MAENDQLPGPDGGTRIPFLGLPLSYGGLPVTRIPAPRLTDDSVKSGYHAIVSVPSLAVRAVNAVSTRIGAPAFSSGTAPSIVKQVYAEGPTPAAFRRRMPAGIIRVWQTARVNVMGIIGRFR